MAMSYGPREGNEERPPWYQPELHEINPSARELLEKYSGVPPERVLEHVKEARERAFDVAKYPCIGEFRFVELTFSRLKFYDEVMRRVKQGQRFLDLGCCFAQDIRKLVFDGAPSDNLYGCDLQSDFARLGYELFLDQQTLKAHFLTADVFAETSELDRLDGSVDIVGANAFFHLFSWDQQKQIASRIIKLLKPQPGSMIVGRQVGLLKGGIVHRDGQGDMFRHDLDTFNALWKEFSDETGIKLTVSAYFEDHWLYTQPDDWHGQPIKPLVYAIWLD